MAPFLLLLFLLSEASSDLIEVTVHPGDDVILSCQAADSSISAVEWGRPDLKPKYVLLSSDGHLKTAFQHSSFKDRVELVDRDLKAGDASLILKNVIRHDAGTYECQVKTDGSGRTKRDTDSEPIRTIRLQVTEPDLPVVVNPGEDVILPCRAADSSISVVKWTRPDLKPEFVLYYSDGNLDPTQQHPSFKDRVELVYSDLKNGVVSLILKNVSSIDNGTYECRFERAGSKRRKRAIDSDLIRTIHLQLPEPAGAHGLVVGALLLVLAVATVVVGLMYKRRDNRPEPELKQETFQLL